MTEQLNTTTMHMLTKSVNSRSKKELKIFTWANLKL